MINHIDLIAVTLINMINNIVTNSCILQLLQLYYYYYNLLQLYHDIFLYNCIIYSTIVGDAISQIIDNLPTKTVHHIYVEST